MPLASEEKDPRIPTPKPVGRSGIKKNPRCDFCAERHLMNVSCTLPTSPFFVRFWIDEHQEGFVPVPTREDGERICALLEKEFLPNIGKPFHKHRPTVFKKRPYPSRGTLLRLIRLE